ncbi:MAG TPA: ATP phosphoribosyltransferase regulatory subunit [Zeimonas sp.]|nr:ATP phosphoribosyltransferase regulatory subunit [Zeimonas sp.]
MMRWLLPESIADVLPAEARAIEELRRRLLDLYRSYGYELVMPPLIEHLESLLTGSGRDLGLRTFQLVDQLSGRTLGVRADMTPQVARIDAHLLDREGVVRLCYAGSVLHTRAQGVLATREPIQIGAELYGHPGIEAEVETIDLMVRSLAAAGVDRLRIDLCHVGVVQGLLDALGPLDAAVDVDELYRLLQGKDVPGLHETLGDSPPALRDALTTLTRLHGRAGAGFDGDDSALARARAQLPAVPAIRDALERVERLCASPALRRWDQLELSIDLADLRGYRYHNGITFAAYVEALPYAVARGGRYDDVGRAFGRARPATGFSIELRALAGLLQNGEPASAIRAPWSDDAALVEAIDALRAAGDIVVQALPGRDPGPQEFVCDRELVLRGNQWVVEPIRASC